VAENQPAWSEGQVIPLLRKVEFFGGLPDEDLERLAGIVDGMDLASGETLFREGSRGDAFYIVYEGAVELLKSRTGGDPEKLAVRRAGDAFGEMALVDDAPRSATARALEDSRLVTIHREAFLGLIGGDNISLRMMKFLSKALRALDMRLGAMEKLSAGAGRSRNDAEEVSRLVQRGLLPRHAPSIDGYDLAAGTTTEDVGRGDTVWDWVPLADGRAALLAYDVQGEGLPPSHYLVAARALIRALAAEFSDPRDILPRANSAFSHAAVIGADQFVEIGIVIPGDEGVEWSSAGLVPAGVIRRDGTFEEMGSHGPPLGMMEGFRYSSRTIPMGPGDVFVVLSQASMGLFRGAADLVAQVQGKTAAEVVTTLHKAIRKAHGNAPEETSVIFVRRH